MPHLQAAYFCNLKHSVSRAPADPFSADCRSRPPNLHGKIQSQRGRNRHEENAYCSECKCEIKYVQEVGCLRADVRPCEQKICLFMRPWLHVCVTQLRPSPSIRLLMHLEGSTHALPAGGGKALIPMWMHMRRHIQDLQEHAWNGGSKTMTFIFPHRLAGTE